MWLYIFNLDSNKLMQLCVETKHVFGYFFLPIYLVASFDAPTGGAFTLIALAAILPVCSCVFYARAHFFVCSAVKQKTFSVPANVLVMLRGKTEGHKACCAAAWCGNSGCNSRAKFSISQRARGKHTFSAVVVKKQALSLSKQLQDEMKDLPRLFPSECCIWVRAGHFFAALEKPEATEISLQFVLAVALHFFR